MLAFRTASVQMQANPIRANQVVLIIAPLPALILHHFPFALKLLRSLQTDISLPAIR
jgi:hypothetical protein